MQLTNWVFVRAEIHRRLAAHLTVSKCMKDQIRLGDLIEIMPEAPPPVNANGYCYQ